MLEYLKVGQIISTHGIKGELKIYPLTDDIKRFDKLKYIFLKNGSCYEKKDIEGIKYIKNMVIIKIKDIDNKEDANNLIDSYIYVNRENAVKLHEGTYFIADLIGMDVFSTDDNYLGKIVSVFPTGSNDIYEIKNENEEKSHLIPAIEDVIKMVDINNRKMIINILEGLYDIWCINFIPRNVWFI